MPQLSRKLLWGDLPAARWQLDPYWRHGMARVVRDMGIPSTRHACHWPHPVTNGEVVEVVTDKAPSGASM